MLLIVAMYTAAIGKVTNLVLMQHVLQWTSSEVRSGNSSLVLYNITIANFSMVPVVSETTENTSLSIDSSLFMSCNVYCISVLPYRTAGSDIEEGIPTLISKEYPGGEFIFSNIAMLHSVYFSTSR